MSKWTAAPVLWIRETEASEVGIHGHSRQEVFLRKQKMLRFYHMAYGPESTFNGNGKEIALSQLLDFWPIIFYFSFSVHQIEAQKSGFLNTTVYVK